VLENAVVYDIETFPNVFTLEAQSLNRDDCFVWEISDRRNDIKNLLEWFNMLHQNQTPMIGYNNLGFDYPVIHMIFMNPGDVTFQTIYQKAMSIINGNKNQRFGDIIWQSDRFAPQIDLYKIHHFDNRAKTQSLKGLEFNMRSETVIDMPVEIGTDLTSEQIDNYLIPYGHHDVSETKKFAQITLPNINFRTKLTSQLSGDVLNFNDTKIGKQLLQQRLGDELCFTREGRQKLPRQTIRHSISLPSVIFPYIKFEHPEFQRVLNWLNKQTLTAGEIDTLANPNAKIQTKGVFTDLKANVGGIEFGFGTGGIHGSVNNMKFEASGDMVIVDADVTSLYPSIAIVNNLSPEHLGDPFVKEYAKLKAERLSHEKGTPENASLKLALNGAYGDSNNIYSFLYDPKFTMAITINGQLLLCMLAEWLLDIPEIELIQINTDGLTVRMDKKHRPQYDAICQRWEKFTLLDLEFANYSNMWVRDVNNYIAQSIGGKIKLKGAYWHPSITNYEHDISNAGPSAWHKNLSAMVTQRAAVAAMVHNVPPEQFLTIHRDPFDYMLRYKCPRGSSLFIGDRKVQNMTRYYIAENGSPMKKISPSLGPVGEFKRNRTCTQAEWDARPVNGQHDERIHTKNKSKYVERVLGINIGYNVAECNVAGDFDFSNINREWYLAEIQKLIIT